MGKRVTLMSAVFVLIVAGVLPLFGMLLKSITAEGGISLAAYRDFLTSRSECGLIVHSLALSLSTTLLTTLIGVPLGIFLGKTDLMFRRGFAVLFTLPLLIPPYMIGIAWFFLVGRRGVLSHLLGPEAGGMASAWFFNLPGCVWVLFSTFLPIVVLMTLIYLRMIDPRLEEAGRLTAGWPRVLGTITLPLISPGILFAAMLVFLLTLGEFGVPSFLRYPVFPVVSLTRFAAFYDFGAATAVAMPLLAITGLALVAERIFLGEKTIQFQPSPGGKFSATIRLGASRLWITAFVGGLCLVVVVLPFSALLFQSLHGNVYREALTRAGDSILRSVAYAAIGASALSVVGFFLGYMVHTRALRFWRTVDTLTLFLFAMSGTVIGIGLIALWNHPTTNFIYGTSAIIIIGYLARYAAIPYRMTVAALAGIPDSMEEAARVAGATWFRRLAFIVVPMAKRGLLGAWLVGYIFCLRDTGITMVVYPPGHETLPVRIFTLMANGSPELIAALCVLMIGVILVPLGIGGAFYKLKGIGLS